MCSSSRDGILFYYSSGDGNGSITGIEDKCYVPSIGYKGKEDIPS